MSQRVPFFEALRWEVTDFGWAAVIELDWPRRQLDRFQPATVAIDEIVYSVTQTEVGGRGARGWEVWLYTWSDLDVIPSQERWMVKSPDSL
jgi:hypothetical protein